MRRPHCWGIALVLLASLASAADADADGRVVTLANDRIVVELIPRLAGRIVTIKRPDGENWIAADLALCTRPMAELPTPTADGAFFSGGGVIVWVGPQRDWWTQQVLNPERQAQHATWPPDPRLEYGTMVVTDRDTEHVDLLGPISPITGLQMAITVSIGADGEVKQMITATNRSERSVAWDLWSNTRVRPDAVESVPIPDGSRFRSEFTSSNPLHERPLRPMISEGSFHFDTRLEPGSENRRHTGKAFIGVDVSGLAQVTADVGAERLVVSAQTPSVEEIHPDQAAIEIYRSAGGESWMPLLEVEFHGAYRALAPGEGMALKVNWNITRAAQHSGMVGSQQ